jgi:hypothetical protein
VNRKKMLRLSILVLAGAILFSASHLGRLSTFDSPNLPFPVLHFIKELMAGANEPAQQGSPSTHQPNSPPMPRGDFPILEVLKNLSQTIYDPGSEENFARRDQALRLQLEAKSDRDFLQVAELFVEGKMPINEARSFLYLLKLAGDKSIPSLELIALSSPRPLTDPDSLDAEAPLRLEAVELLDLQAEKNPQAQRALLKIESLGQNKSLTFFVEVATAGLRRNHPGALHRLLEASANGEITP